MGRLAIIVPAICVLVVLSGCKSTNWEERYLKKQEENRALRESLDVQNEQLAEKDASAEQLRRDMDDTQAEIDALAAELDSIPKQSAPTRDAAYDDLMAEYERLRKAYGEMVRITEDGNLEITLPASINFASGSYKLTNAGRSTLNSVASDLTSRFPSHRVNIIGHTDNDPIKKSPFKDNLELGAERACEVLRYLGTKGVDQDRLTASSMGANRPVASNATKEGKSKNRRVEIVVIMPKSTTGGNTKS